MGRPVKVCPMTLLTFCTIRWLVQLRLDGMKALRSKNCHSSLKKRMAGFMNAWILQGNASVLLQKWMVHASTSSGSGKLQTGKIMFRLKSPNPYFKSGVIHDHISRISGYRLDGYLPDPRSRPAR